MFRKRKNSYKNFSDEQLLATYKDTKSQLIVAELFNRFQHLIFGVGLRYFKNEADAHELVSQVFEKLNNDLSKHEITNFQGWIYQVARNACLMTLRSRKRKEAKIEEASTYIHGEGGGDEKLALEHRLDALELAMTKLATEQRTCISLFYLESKSYSEIETITGFTNKQVKSYIQNGKRNLRLGLEAHGNAS